MRNMFKVFLVAGLISVTFQPSMASGQLFFMENEIKGKPAPDFTLKTLSGEESSLASIRQGKKAIVFFWATWCPHCRKALSELNQRREEFAQKGIQLVIVDLGEKSEVVQKYVEKNGITLTIFLDEESSLADPYGLIGVPTFFFVKEDGNVADVQHGLPENLDNIFNK